MISTLSEKLYLSDTVFQTLRDRIVAQEYKPGTMLSEKELCREFSVSRTPLREAIRKLEEMKLVNVVPRFGTYVSEININEIKCAYEVRLKLEHLAAELAAQRANSEQLERLEKMLREAEAFAEDPAHGEMSDWDNRFHDIICEMAENPVLADMIFKLRLTCSRLWTSRLRESLPVKEMVRQGRELYEAMKRGDSESAAEYMVKHVQFSIDCLRNHLL